MDLGLAIIGGLVALFFWTAAVGWFCYALGKSHGQFEMLTKQMQQAFRNTQTGVMRPPA